jgi:hypothetical protein
VSAANAGQGSGAVAEFSSSTSRQVLVTHSRNMIAVLSGTTGMQMAV